MGIKCSLFTADNCLLELNDIANWWLNNTQDPQENGFIGQVDSTGKKNTMADRGIVLNSRILWFFSEAAQFIADEPSKKQQFIAYKKAATQAFDFIIKHFDDKNFGGSLWEVSAEGTIKSAKKQTYAQSFCIYAFTAYYQLTKNTEALDKALDYFELLETYAKDTVYGGYIEAFDQQWQTLGDFRLSDKDLNCPKSMNTHLHVLEAYSALYKVAPSPKIKTALTYIIDIFVDKVVDKESAHLKLFFDKQWQDLSTTYSYGHDIEASWLLWESLEILNDSSRIECYQPIVISLAQSCLKEAIGEHGQVCDEYCLSENYRHQESYWWVQAEALVGFLNAFKLTKNQEYYDVCQPIWDFIQAYHLDPIVGEWHWTATIDQHKPSNNPTYKAGFWKGPYHNGRAMMEIVKLFSMIKSKSSSHLIRKEA